MSERPATAPPAMLKDLIADCQRMSATLPPDNWDETASAPSAQRSNSGTLRLSTVRKPSRRVASAPAASPSLLEPKVESSKAVWRPQRYYQSNPPSTPRPGTANPSTDSLQVNPPTPVTVPKFPRAETNNSPYPSMSLTRSIPSRTPIPLANAPTPARPIPRVRPSESRQALLSSTTPNFSHSHGVHLPSPLRNVSMPGEGDSDIELLPTGLPRALYEFPGPHEEKAGGWWRKWFGCCG